MSRYEARKKIDEYLEEPLDPDEAEQWKRDNWGNEAQESSFWDDFTIEGEQ